MKVATLLLALSALEAGAGPALEALPIHCRSGEHASSGHCCPAATDWQSGGCKLSPEALSTSDGGFSLETVQAGGKLVQVHLQFGDSRVTPADAVAVVDGSSYPLTSADASFVASGLVAGRQYRIDFSASGFETTGEYFTVSDDHALVFSERLPPFIDEVRVQLPASVSNDYGVRFENGDAELAQCVTSDGHCDVSVPGNTMKQGVLLTARGPLDFALPLDQDMPFAGPGQRAVLRVDPGRKMWGGLPWMIAAAVVLLAAPLTVALLSKDNTTTDIAVTCTGVAAAVDLFALSYGVVRGFRGDPHPSTRWSVEELK